MGGTSGKFAGGLDTLTNDGSERYALSEGGRVEPKQVGRVTPCAPTNSRAERRARSDAPYPPSLRHYSESLNPIDCTIRASTITENLPDYGP